VLRQYLKAIAVRSVVNLRHLHPVVTEKEDDGCDAWSDFTADPSETR
jgi:hypothetical protein